MARVPSQELYFMYLLGNMSGRQPTEDSTLQVPSQEQTAAFAGNPDTHHNAQPHAATAGPPEATVTRSQLHEDQGGPNVAQADAPLQLAPQVAEAVEAADSTEVAAASATAGPPEATVTRSQLHEDLGGPNVAQADAPLQLAPQAAEAVEAADSTEVAAASATAGPPEATVTRSQLHADQGGPNVGQADAPLQLAPQAAEAVEAADSTEVAAASATAGPPEATVTRSQLHEDQGSPNVAQADAPLQLAPQAAEAVEAADSTEVAAASATAGPPEATVTISQLHEDRGGPNVAQADAPLQLAPQAAEAVEAADSTEVAAASATAGPPEATVTRSQLHEDQGGPNVAQADAPLQLAPQAAEAVEAADSTEVAAASATAGPPEATVTRSQLHEDQGGPNVAQADAPLQLAPQAAEAVEAADSTEVAAASATAGPPEATVTRSQLHEDLGGPNVAQADAPLQLAPQAAEAVEAADSTEVAAASATAGPPEATVTRSQLHEDQGGPNVAQADAPLQLAPQAAEAVEAADSTEVAAASATAGPPEATVTRSQLHEDQGGPNVAQADAPLQLAPQAAEAVEAADSTEVAAASATAGPPEATVTRSQLHEDQGGPNVAQADAPLQLAPQAAEAVEAADSTEVAAASATAGPPEATVTRSQLHEDQGGPNVAQADAPLQLAPQAAEAVEAADSTEVAAASATAGPPEATVTRSQLHEDQGGPNVAQADAPLQLAPQAAEAVEAADSTEVAAASATAGPPEATVTRSQLHEDQGGPNVAQADAPLQLAPQAAEAVEAADSTEVAAASATAGPPEATVTRSQLHEDQGGPNVAQADAPLQLAPQAAEAVEAADSTEVTAASATAGPPEATVTRSQLHEDQGGPNVAQADAPLQLAPQAAEAVEAADSTEVAAASATAGPPEATVTRSQLHEDQGGPNVAQADAPLQLAPQAAEAVEAADSTEVAAASATAGPPEATVTRSQLHEDQGGPNVAQADAPLQLAPQAAEAVEAADSTEVAAASATAGPPEATVTRSQLHEDQGGPNVAQADAPLQLAPQAAEAVKAADSTEVAAASATAGPPEATVTRSQLHEDQGGPNVAQADAPLQLAPQAAEAVKAADSTEVAAASATAGPPEATVTRSQLHEDQGGPNVAQADAPLQLAPQAAEAVKAADSTEVAAASATAGPPEATVTRSQLHEDQGGPNVAQADAPLQLAPQAAEAVKAADSTEVAAASATAGPPEATVTRSQLHEDQGGPNVAQADAALAEPFSPFGRAEQAWMSLDELG